MLFLRLIESMVHQIVLLDIIKNNKYNPILIYAPTGHLDWWHVLVLSVI